MTLDYSYSGSFALTVGGVDFTSCLTSFVWGLPLHEPEQALVYTGSIELSFSYAAAAAGLTEASLSPVSNPQLWEAGQARVVLSFPSLANSPALTFRLSKWRYDVSTNKGTGSLTQQIQLYDKPFLELDPEVVFANAATGADNVQSVITKLLQASNSKVRADLAMLVGAVDCGFASTDQIWGIRQTRNPMSEVQSYAKQGWAWLTQSLLTEQAEVKPLDYGASPLVFSLPAASASVTPLLDNLDFAAPFVIAHGSCDVPDDCQGDTDANTANNGKPKRQVTESVEPEGKIFPKQSPSEVLYTSQRKTILYYYLSDITLVSPEFYPKPFPPIPTDAGSGLYRVETIIEEPAGKIFAKLGSRLDLQVSSRTIEVAQWKATYKPRGVVLPALAGDFTEILDTVETLQTKYSDGFGRDGRLQNGKHGCIDQAKPEQPQPVQVKLVSKTFTGRAELVRGFVPAIDNPYVYSMGFCTSQAAADSAAAKVALRETARRYADSVVLPMPTAWLSAGCPQYSKCRIGTKEYWLDGPAAELKSDAEGRLSLTLQFTGMHIANVQAVAEVAQQPYDPAGLSYAPGQGPLSTVPAELTVYSGASSTIQL